MFGIPPVPSITPADVAARRKATPDELVLVDVRSPEERAFAHIEGRHIPLNELPGRLDELQSLADRTIVVYCRTGHRSASAVSWLRSRGLDNVYNLEGGMHGWHRTVDPTVPIY